jgi:cytochrome b
MSPAKSSDPSTGNRPGRKVLIWDLPTRLFHWLTVALVLAAYLTWRVNWMDWHAKVGDAVLTLVSFRLLWGFFGSDTTRFADFLARPGVALRHLTHLFHREPDRSAGHNAAGGWMVLLLIGLLFGESLSGLHVANDVADQGPFTELVPAKVANAITSLHWIFWDALIAAIVLHVAAIAIYAVAKGQNLVVPMVTGRKCLPADVPQPRMMGVLRAVAFLGGSALAVAVLANVL